MQDKQNKGIGAYKDRPGYFMGGMIGGAILGALVNKVQGKDWKRGAIWGGIGGGLGSWAAKSFMPAGVAKAGSPQLMAGWGKLPWYKKMLATAGSKFGVPAAVAGTGAAIGLGTSYLAGDPEYDQRKWEEKLAAQKAAERRRNLDFYDKWYTNPWTGESMSYKSYNSGGIINARPGYLGGGSATLEYTDPDLYTPTGEGKGPTSKPIINIPLGPEPSFADEFEDFDYMEKASSDGDESGWYEMFFNEFGRPPVDIKELQLFIDQSDISPTDVAARGGGQGPMMAAEGGYKTRPGYADAGPVDMPYDPEEEDKTYWERLLDAASQGIEKGRIDADKIKEWLDSKGFKAEGGIADLDMTGGGASFGPGTGTSDDIPAMLSDGEFVVTANAVKNLGEGDRMLGAQRMYRMMNQLDPNSQTPAEMSGIGYA